MLLGVVFLGSSLFLTRFVGAEFLPESDESQFNVVVQADPGWSLDATDQVVKDIESRLEAHPSRSKTFSPPSAAAPWNKVNHATILINLVEPGERDQTQLEDHEPRSGTGSLRFKKPAFRWRTSLELQRPAAGRLNFKSTFAAPRRPRSMSSSP